MLKYGVRAMLLLGLLAAAPAPGADQHWLPVRKFPEGTIFHRRTELSAYSWVMIRTTFAAPPEEVFALVNDYDRFAGFIPNVAESRVVLTEGHSRLVYHHLHFPGPVTDRVYLMESSDASSRPDVHDYRIEWQLSGRMVAGVDLSGGVRPNAFSGFWQLKQGALPGTTDAEYAIYSDPGGLVPAWLATTMTDRYVRQLVSAIRLRLDKSE